MNEIEDGIRTLGFDPTEYLPHILTAEERFERKRNITTQWLRRHSTCFRMNGKFHQSLRANTNTEHLLSQCGYDPDLHDLIDANGRRYHHGEIIILLEGMRYEAKKK